MTKKLTDILYANQLFNFIFIFNDEILQSLLMVVLFISLVCSCDFSFYGLFAYAAANGLRPLYSPSGSLK